jgi:hypothetical protein
MNETTELFERVTVRCSIDESEFALARLIELDGKIVSFQQVGDDGFRAVGERPRNISESDGLKMKQRLASQS